jgi:hypothetical protein
MFVIRERLYAHPVDESSFSFESKEMAVTKYNLIYTLRSTTCRILSSLNKIPFFGIN